eukprot:CAMPEP_0185841504 /NCGR_PEP_ID=MMETSP1353-20130828/17926_1 /TAXON_ID=1077150 /ORGANISM="Erythrolobus australicus, Strain CCMP3124" /LENGTH=442 /DNA_ID=CAMNT_0028540983 /DNA_START=129 /DNA_END=1457 /DNA_ORIENTATION=-
MSEDRARQDLEFKLEQTYNEIRYARRRLIEEYEVVYTELAQTARNCRKANVGAAAVSCAGGVTGAVAVGAGIALGPVAWVAAAGAAALGLAAGGAATAVGTSITEGCINHSLLKRLEAASQHEADMLQLLEELIAKANTNLRISAQQVAKIILAPLLKSALQSGAMIAAGRTVPNLVCGEAAKVAGNLSDETEEYEVVYTELAQTARNCRKANVGAAAVSCAGGVASVAVSGAVVVLGPVAWAGAAGAAALGLAAGGAATAVGTKLTESCINHSLLKRLEAASQHEADMLQLLEKHIEAANTKLRDSALQVAWMILKPLLKNALKDGAMISAGRAVPSLFCGEAAKVAGNLSDETAQVVGQGIVKASTKQVAGKAAATFGANAAKYGAVVVKYAGPVISVGAAAYSVYDLVVQCNELYADKPAELAEVVKKMKIALEEQFKT